MARKSKAVVVGQVFIYIIAIIVFAVVLIFGYKAITGFLDKGEKVAYVTFVTDLENSFRNVYRDVGTVVIYDEGNQFSVPSGYKEVCFVDLDYGAKISAGLCSSGHDNFDPIICDVWTSYNSWEAGDQNVFLKPRGLSPIKVVNLETEDGYLCLDVVQGRINFRLEGLGNRVLISEV